MYGEFRPQHINAGEYRASDDVSYLVRFDFKDEWAGRVNRDMFEDYLTDLHEALELKYHICSYKVIGEA